MEKLEVKRYHVCDTGLAEGTALGRTTVVLGADFDRVTAERDEALAEVERMLQTAAMYQKLYSESQSELTKALELFAHVWEFSERLPDGIRDPIHAFRARQSAPVCCVETPEELELMRNGDYNAEELYGIGGKPSCPKCAGK